MRAFRNTSGDERPRAGFSLIELLLVIAIIAIMASLVISAFSNASSDTRYVLARQQQAAVQQALNSWIAYHSSPPVGSLTSARSLYNGRANGKARLMLIQGFNTSDVQVEQGYLDEATYDHLIANTSDVDKIRSDAMVKISKYLEITDWPSGSYPKVNLLP